MRTLVVILALATGGLGQSADRTPASLVLSRPSVVVVFTPGSEVTATSRQEPGFDDFIDDFEYYARSLAVALRSDGEVAFYNSSAREIQFAGREHPPVTRQSLSGFGFVVYVPGKDPVIFQGVATDDDVLCALKALDPRLKISPQCGPNKSFERNPLRGPA